eukprot:PhF_6_TR36167/c0_g1_i3/m.52632
MSQLQSSTLYSPPPPSRSHQLTFWDTLQSLMELSYFETLYTLVGKKYLRYGHREGLTMEQVATLVLVSIPLGDAIIRHFNESLTECSMPRHLEPIYWEFLAALKMLPKGNSSSSRTVYRGHTSSVPLLLQSGEVLRSPAFLTFTSTPLNSFQRVSDTEGIYRWIRLLDEVGVLVDISRYGVASEVVGSAEQDLFVLEPGVRLVVDTVSSNTYPITNNEDGSRDAPTIGLHVEGVHNARKLQQSIYACGGTVNGMSTNIVERYDPSCKLWFSVAPMTARRSHCACGSIGTTVYVAGGRDELWRHLNTAECFTEAIGEWNVIPPMSTPRWACAGATIHQIQGFLVTGGIDDYMRVVATCEIYDTNVNAWRSAASMNAARSHHSAAAIDDNVYVVVGGTETHEHMVEWYDSLVGKWTTVVVQGNIPTPIRRSAALVVMTLPEGHRDLLYLGGVVDGLQGNQSVLNTIETWKLVQRGESDKTELCLAPSTVLSNFHYARQGCRCVCVNGVLYVIGGDDLRNTIGVVEEYDPSLGVWTFGLEMITPRSSLAAVIV